MGAIRTLTIDLPADLAGALDGALESGDYASEGDVVHQALSAWQRERDADSDTTRLRALWDEGIASGPAIDGGFDIEDIVRRGNARLAAERQS